MGDLDVIPIPGYPGKWARRAVVSAWITAGRPPILWAGRTYEEQKRLYDLWRHGKGNAADNPDANTRQPHVRGMALDLADANPSAAVVAAMTRAGFSRPVWISNGYSQNEPWHFELKKYISSIRSVPKVTASQVADLVSPSGGGESASGGGESVFKPSIRRDRDDMAKLFYRTQDDKRTGPAAEWALAGSGDGEAAWLPIQDQALANALAADSQSGRAIWLSKGTWDLWKAKYLGT